MNNLQSIEEEYDKKYGPIRYNQGRIDGIKQERNRILKIIDEMIKKEISAKPETNLERTAEWYMVSALEALISKLNEQD